MAQSEGTGPPYIIEFKPVNCSFTMQQRPHKTFALSTWRHGSSPLIGLCLSPRIGRLWRNSLNPSRMTDLKIVSEYQ